MNTGRSQDLYKKAKRMIPGGTQLLSKRPEQFAPGQWPAYYAKAKGAEVWDIDGNMLIDMSYSGIGACVLGYADPDVNAAVMAAVQAGSMCTLNCPEEVELAELLCELHPWADMVRYARCGGEAMAVAVRIARAKTKRDKVALCGYHGWHDWYLSTNLAEQTALDGHLLPGLDPAGVPRGLQGTTHPFRYNHIEELEAIAAKHGPELAAIVMEPIRDHDPAPWFLERVREIATQASAVLIFDEVSSGFRIATGGAHLKFGVTPDVAVLAKALGNGYPMAAVLGRGEVMQAAQDSFISSTYWTERIGPAAAIATIRKHRDRDVPAHLVRMGSSVMEEWTKAAARAGLAIEVGGMAPLCHFAIEGAQAQAARTLYTQLMLDRGFMAGAAFYASFAHREEHVQRFSAALGEVFPIVADALRKNDVERLLRGPVAHSGFKRLT